jgi:hypothetical protein
MATGGLDTVVIIKDFKHFPMSIYLICYAWWLIKYVLYLVFSVSQATSAGISLKVAFRRIPKSSPKDSAGGAY